MFFVFVSNLEAMHSLPSTSTHLNVLPAYYRLASILADLLNIKIKIQESHHVRLSNKERIGFEDVYEYILQKNRLDLELHKFAKNHSLVDCSRIKSEQKQMAR